MNKKKIMIVTVAVLVVGILAVFLLNNNDKKEIEFPYDIDDGKLTVQSIFQSSIDNPDCQDEYGDDIASLEIINNSDELLEEADITVETDEKTLTFHIEYLPSHETMWVFESNNETITLDEAYFNITVDSKYTDQTLETEKLDVTVETYQTEVAVKNKTTQDIKDISLTFHTKFEEILYGGKTYNYQINELKANESVKVDVIEAYLGTPETVQIKINDKGEE